MKKSYILDKFIDFTYDNWRFILRLYKNKKGERGWMGKILWIKLIHLRKRPILSGGRAFDCIMERRKLYLKEE